METPEKKENPQKWYYGRGAVIFGLFLLGPLGFPLLWKSPRFNLFWKIALTVIFSAATYYAFVGTWQAISILIGQIKSRGPV